MRTYYLLMVDPNRTDLQSVVNSTIAGQKLIPLKLGVPGETTIFAEGKLVVSHKPPADLVGNGSLLRIMSDRLLSIIRQFVPEEDLQVFPAPLMEAQTNKRVLGYSVVNCLRKIEALAPGCSPDRLIVGPLEIEETAVPQSVHLFRLAEQPSYHLVSEELQAALSERELQGVLTVPMKTVILS